MDQKNYTRRTLIVLAVAMQGLWFMPAQGLYTAFAGWELYQNSSFDSVKKRISYDWRDFVRDWKSPTGLLEVGAPFFSAGLTDIVSSLNPKQAEALSSLPVIAAVGTNIGLRARMFVESYQEHRFGQAGKVSSWLQDDVRLALEVFCSLSSEDAKKIIIRPLRAITRFDDGGWDCWNPVANMWLGIVPTNSAIFVDEIFLAQFRTDPLMYGFLLGYGMFHFAKKTFVKQNSIELIDTGIQSFLGIKMITGSEILAQKGLDSTVNFFEQKTPLAIWKWEGLRSFSDYSGDAQRGWATWVPLMVARKALAVGGFFLRKSIEMSLMGVVMGCYSGITERIKQKIFDLSCALNPLLFRRRMGVWMQKFGEGVGTQEDLTPHQRSLITEKIAEQKQFSLLDRLGHISKNYIKIWLSNEEIQENKNVFRVILLKKIDSDIDRFYKLEAQRMKLAQRLLDS